MPVNERTNRQLRRFLPKEKSINRVSAEQVLMFAAEINAAPRKRLDIILRMNSLRRTSAESTWLLVSNRYSDRCSICYCNS